MLAALRNAFDLRASDARQVVRAGLALFAVLAAFTLLETARDALFLQVLPLRDLAIAYGATAGLTLVSAPVVARLARRIGRRDTLVAGLALAALGTALLYLLPLTRSVVLALYVWTGLVAMLVVAQSWVATTELFPCAEGKRTLGVVATAGALGAVAAAAVASVALLWLPVQHLLPLAGGLFLVAGGAVRATRPADTACAEPADATRAFVAVRHESYLRRLALLVAVSTAAMLATDYLFKAGAVRAIAPDQLPVFFARFAAVATSATLLVQVVGVGCLIRRNGVLAALTVLPLALLLGAGGAALLGGAFAVVVVARTVDAILRHSLHRVSMELVWRPIPEDVRDDVKDPIHGALVSIVQAATAAGLLALAILGLDTPVVLAALVAGLAAAWLIAAALLRRPYLDQFRQALARPTFAPARDQDLDLDAVEVVVEAMSSPDPRQVRAAIAMLATHGKARLVSALVLLHDDAEVLCDALAVVATPDRRDWIPQSRRLLEHASPAVRTAALRALARVGALDVAGCTTEADPPLRGHLAFWRAHTSERIDMIEDADVAAILAAPGDDGRIARAALLDAIGEDGDVRWASVVLAMVQAADDGAELVARAVPAMERAADPQFIPVLIDRLAVRRGRADVMVALAQLGTPAQAALEDAFIDPATPTRRRVHLPQAIGAFGNQRAADFLSSQLGVHGAAGYRVLRELARVAVRHGARVDRRAAVAELERNLREHVRLLGVDAALARSTRDDALPTLRGLLADKREQATERVFLLLQAVHPGEDLRDVHQALTSGGPASRAHARELLVAITRHYDERVRELVLLLADDLSADERLARGYALLAEPLPDRRDALALLLGDDDPAVVALASLHARAVASSPAIDVPSALATIALGPLTAPAAVPVARAIPAVPGRFLASAVLAPTPPPPASPLARGTGTHPHFDLDVGAAPAAAPHPGPATSPLSPPRASGAHGA